MKTEFMFKFPGQKDFMSLTDLIEQMTEILSNKVVQDFQDLDKIMIEVYDNRLSSTAGHGSLGKMPLPILIQKFR
jgi:predicted HTH transcriptional regulator